MGQFYHLVRSTMTYHINRRTVLKGIAGTGLTLTVSGIASANERTRYLVRIEQDRAADRIERAGYEIRNELAAGEVLLVEGPEDSQDDLRNIRGVQIAIPDFEVRLEDPIGEQEAGATRDQPEYWDRQWDKHVTDVERAHDIATGDGTTIAILDTGIDHTHPDLQNVNVEKSRSVYGGELRPHSGDPHYHGTHVAGIAAGTGEEGIIGTAPDAELISLRVFTFGEEEQPDFWSDLLLAIEYAADQGADAANMSIGTLETLPPQVNAGGVRGVMQPVMHHATRQGTVVVASAGNHGESLQQGGSFTIPNSLSGVMSVSATGPNDELVFYSNWGINEIDVGAPGGGYETLERTLDPEADVDWPYPTNLVLSSLPTAEKDPRVPGRYGYLGGTSMAAPQVAGAVALVKDAHPDLNAEQVENAIKQGADLVRGRGDSELGAGRLNVHDALK